MGNIYLFGSEALKWNYSDYPKEPKDYDLISSDVSEFYLSVINTVYRFNKPERKVEVFWCDAMEYLVQTNQPFVLPPDILYTIKLSHLPWDLKNNSWWKHVKDVVFLQNKGVKLHEKFFCRLQQDWVKLHGSKERITLNKSVKEFFNDSLNRQYNHDDLHEYFKIGLVPAYTLTQKDSDSALCSEELFNSLTEYQKYCTILEEVFVIAYERNLSFYEGLRHLITRISKGYWNKYILEHLNVILSGKFDKELEVYKQLRSKLNARKITDE